MTSLSASLANYYWNDTLLRIKWFQTLQEEPIQLVLLSVWMSSQRLFAQANPRDLWFSECGSKASQTQRSPCSPVALQWAQAAWRLLTAQLSESSLLRPDGCFVVERKSGPGIRRRWRMNIDHPVAFPLGKLGESTKLTGPWMEELTCPGRWESGA